MSLYKLQPVCGPAGRAFGDLVDDTIPALQPVCGPAGRMIGLSMPSPARSLQPVCGPAGRVMRYPASCITSSFNPSAVRLEAGDAPTRAGAQAASTRLRSGWKARRESDRSRRRRRFNPSAVRLEGSRTRRDVGVGGASTRLRSGWKQCSYCVVRAWYWLQPVCGPAGSPPVR